MMNDKRLLGCFAIMLLLVFCSLSLVPYVIYRQIPQLANYEDTRLVGQNVNGRFSRPLCLSTFYLNQEYTADISGAEVWERLSSQWNVRPDTHYPDRNEAYFQQELLGGLVLNSNVNSFDRGSDAFIEISNHFVVKFPQRLCYPLGS